MRLADQVGLLVLAEHGEFEVVVIGRVVYYES
jgi:hypothetical protein